MLPKRRCTVSIPGGKPLHEPLGVINAAAHKKPEFQSQAGSPSTSHRESSVAELNGPTVSIPGGKPLHEPRRDPAPYAKQGKVSIPGGKPLHEPHIASFMCSDARGVSIPGGKPLHEPLSILDKVQALKISFNPWREAPPRATGKVILFALPTNRFNPWREAPPRATQKSPPTRL